MSKLIKIYGERNTNTNYVSKLINLNLEAHLIPGVVPRYIMRFQHKFPGDELIKDAYFRFTFNHNLGWKHSAAKPVSTIANCPLVRNNDVLFLTITKNPYSWLLSLYRRPYHQYYSNKPDFETFLNSSWKTVGRDNTKKRLENPIELWNMKNASYLQLSGLNVLNITTESVFEDPEAVITKISNSFSIRKLSDKFINYDRSTKDSRKDSNYYRDYYLNERWRNELSNNARAIINESVDKKLMAYFGYKLLS
jgi:hypothetical protein